MKILLSLFAIMLLNKECDQSKSTDSTSMTVNAEAMTDVAQDYSKVWYEATTRGFYEKIWITKDSITVTNDRNHMSSNKYATSLEDWNELLTILKDVDVNAMPDLEAPTSKRHYDGAAFASLGVAQNKTEIQSNSFDHGNPPKAIEAVVNKVLSMKKSFDKK
ncbi:MAG: hypothetical protein ACSHXF_03690 [Aquaticitalea sp.]